MCTEGAGADHQRVAGKEAPSGETDSDAGSSVDSSLVMWCQVVWSMLQESKNQGFVTGEGFEGINPRVNTLHRGRCLE